MGGTGSPRLAMMMLASWNCTRLVWSAIRVKPPKKEQIADYLTWRAKGGKAVGQA